jgi:hypothetical protein
VVFGLSPPTTKETDFQDLPPEPEDEVKSTSKSSQKPISVGSDTVTTGVITAETTEIVEFWGSLVLQLLQKGSTFEVHRAFNTPVFKVNTSPGSMNAPNEDISSEESLVHTQREDEGREWNDVTELDLKRNPQEITFTTLPRLVGDVKVTCILLPSEENSDRCIEGGGKASSTPFTTNTSPAGNTTL